MLRTIFPDSDGTELSTPNDSDNESEPSAPSTPSGLPPDFNTVDNVSIVIPEIILNFQTSLPPLYRVWWTTNPLLWPKN